MNKSKLFYIMFANIALFSCTKLTYFIPIEVDKAIGENFAATFDYHPTSGKVLDSAQNQKNICLSEQNKNESFAIGQNFTQKRFCLETKNN